MQKIKLFEGINFFTQLFVTVLHDNGWRFPMKPLIIYMENTLKTLSVQEVSYSVNNLRCIAKPTHPSHTYKTFFVRRHEIILITCDVWIIKIFFSLETLKSSIFKNLWLWLFDFYLYLSVHKLILEVNDVTTQVSNLRLADELSLKTHSARISWHANFDVNSNQLMLWLPIFFY